MKIKNEKKLKNQISAAYLTTTTKKIFRRFRFRFISTQFNLIQFIYISYRRKYNII